MLCTPNNSLWIYFDCLYPSMEKLNQTKHRNDRKSNCWLSPIISLDLVTIDSTNVLVYSKQMIKLSQKRHIKKYEKNKHNWKNSYFLSLYEGITPSLPLTVNFEDHNPRWSLHITIVCLPGKPSFYL
jgi:hypothetical protein